MKIHDYITCALIAVGVILLLTSCAYESKIEDRRPGEFTITSVESDLGGGANALSWEINYYADEKCPEGYVQSAQLKERTPAATKYITTIKCK